ncbi:MAG: SDR family NAD(P)-dependent oxidoreductase [Firmicutes bacterium]|nr:SDR family NAD(P)-dependent oxidoreductase [Bacillota bacterium]
MEIAIIGTSVLYPGSTDDRGFWQDILRGRDLIEDVPPDRWLLSDYYDPDPSAEDMTYVRRGAFLSPLVFDPVAFGMPPANISATDTSQLLALVAAKRLLDELVREHPDLDRDRVSVILGVASTTELVLELNARLQHPKWRRVLEASGVAPQVAEALSERFRALSVPWQESSFPGLLGNVVAGRIANRFDLGGTNAVVDAACASSLAALEMAILELEAHRADLVLTGGVDTLNDIFMYLCFSKTRALSPTEDCRPFSDQADGTILGEGVGLFALKRLRDAERDGDPVLAVIRGLGSSSDGAGTAIYAPKSAGQIKALTRAYREAGVDPRSVELLEAHGTGTAAGDAAEFEALTQVYGTPVDSPWCALGSVKSQIGHAKAAAGAAGLFKAVMALHHGVLPPTIKVESPNPQLRIETSPFYLNTAARPWIHRPGTPRRAAVSAFGFGGSNFHLVLEEYRDARGRRSSAKLRTISTEWIPLSADSRQSLRALISRALTAGTDQSLSALAYECQRHFDSTRPVRLAVVCQSRTGLDELLRQSLDRLNQLDKGNPVRWPVGVYYGEGSRSGGVAFLFPGQGSQCLFMGRDLAITFDAVRNVLDQLAGEFGDGPALLDLLYPHSLWTASDRENARQRLTETQWAQPAIGAVSAAFVALLWQLGLKADAVAGHSFGELTALYAAGAISLEALMQLARSRGALMAAAAQGKVGAMTAVMTDRERLQSAVRASGRKIAIAGDNAPDQVVVAGDRAEIEHLEAQLAASHVAYKRLSVSAAFHTPHVAAAVDPFRQVLNTISWNPLAIPVYSNVTGDCHDTDLARLKDRLAQQIAEPVAFRSMLEAMFRDGVRVFLEVGPGSALTSLVKHTLGDRVAAVSLDRSGQDGILSLCHALAELATCGVPFDPLALWQEYAVPSSFKEEPSAAAVRISGSNYGKPYPAILETFSPLPALVSSPTPASSLPKQGLPETPPTPAAFPDTVWQGAIEESLVKAHLAFQDALSQGHQAFLKMAEETFKAWASETVPREVGTSNAKSVPFAQAAPSSPFQKEPAPHGVGEGLSEPPEPVASAPPAQAQIVDWPPEPDAWALVRAVVADKTGYPADILQPEQSLEQDLGIDSIKRVEILSALADRLGQGQAVDAGVLSRLRTLGDVVREIAALREGPRDTGERVASEPDAWALVRAVVADKTGYPADILQPEQSLEQDLGIDSIKRVEILSALADRLGQGQAVDAGVLSRLRTLGDVVSVLIGGRPDNAPLLEKSQGVPPSKSLPQHIQAWTLSYQPAAFSGLSLYLPMRHGPLYLVGGAGPLSEALLKELEGLPVIGVRTVDDVPDHARAIVYLGGADVLSRADDPVQVPLAAFHCARRLVSQASQGARLFVAVEHTGGLNLSASGESASWAGLRGLVKTVGQEAPNVAVKTVAVDIQLPPQTVARLVAQELLLGGADPDVAYADDGTRVVPIWEKATPDGDPVPLQAGSVLVVSGGARGVTAAIVKALARRAPLRIGILGRTIIPEGPFPRLHSQAEARAWATEEARRAESGATPRRVHERASEILAMTEIAETLEALQALGSEVVYLPCDVRDSQAVGLGVAEVRRRFGPIQAVLHGAGVIRDRLLPEKTEDDFRTVFDTKVLGLKALLEHTAGDPVTHLAVISSVASQFGNAGQGDYAMANAVLNALAVSEQRRRRDAVVVAWECGPWDGGMVTEELRRRFLQQGVGLIPLEEGAEWCVKSWQQRLSAVEWIVGVSTEGATAGEVRDRIGFWSLGADQGRYLEGHKIHATVVVPMTVAMAQMMRAASAVRPELSGVEMTDVQVLRGIRLRQFFEGVESLEVAASAVESGVPGQQPDSLAIPVKIRDLQGTALYQARVVLGTPEPIVADEELQSQPPGPWPCTRDEIYTEKLFHEGVFTVIEQLEHFTEHGVTAYLRVPQGLGEAETAALTWDGGFQLLGVWGLTYIERRTLPTLVSRMQLGRPLVVGERVRCAVHVRRADSRRLVADIEAVGADGAVVFRLLGVEMHAIGEKTRSWRKPGEVAP